MIAGYAAAGSETGYAAATPEAMLVQDRLSCIPLTNSLQHGDIILLLTPIVAPVNDDSGRDPFEPLGRNLAKYHPWVRHVPYTVQSGITSTHVAFIKRAKVVLFVISGPPCSGQPSQVELSNIVQHIGEHRPHVVVACCNVQDLDPAVLSFPTIIQLQGYSSRELEIGADLLFLGRPTQINLPPKILAPPELSGAHRWAVTQWNHARDGPAVHELWCQCMPPRFKLNLASLLGILHRDGYAKHFVVRSPETNEILGFCATYITYLDSKGENLVGSVAVVFVTPAYRRRGIGSILHEEALRGFKKTRGVTRLQLGSTFPRLLYGLPADHPAEDWFKRRRWIMNNTLPGTGQGISDWLLAFDEWPTDWSPPSGLKFRQCGFVDFDQVLEIVGRESERHGNMGWYDQYAKLAESISMNDIILGFAGETIVATAITYIMHSDNPSAEDIPWAGSISSDTGGVTCICITGMLRCCASEWRSILVIDDSSDHLNRDSVMVRLLDACVHTLSQKGKRRLYLDAVKGGDANFQAMGS